VTHSTYGGNGKEAAECCREASREEVVGRSNGMMMSQSIFG